MHFVEQNFGDVRVLSIKGKLTDTPETDQLHERIKLILDEKQTKIVLDLKHVHWLASVGIGAIMRCVMTVRTAGGDLRLTGLTDKVLNIFSITKLTGVIDVYDSVHAAVESFE
jgi:anti-anti-sigma factor